MVDIPLTIFVSGIGALLVAIGLIIGFFYVYKKYGRTIMNCWTLEELGFMANQNIRTCKEDKMKI